MESVPDENRLKIINNFIEFCYNFLKDLNLTQIVVYLNGSFTTKKQRPNDLDLIVFLNWEDQKKHEKVLNNKYKHETLLVNNLLDVYFLLIYPESHPNYFHTSFDRAYWISQFTRTRPNHRGKIYKKGLLQLTVTEHDLK